MKIRQSQTIAMPRLRRVASRITTIAPMATNSSVAEASSVRGGRTTMAL
ncbi:hypothetical protein [Ponticoccus litoralis]|uniref:Uncharacterized protein n=1 Tax=Ponticoccus litoralis TaxID=422297 RepID=A0AAW9SJY6_9RHOB